MASKSSCMPCGVMMMLCVILLLSAHANTAAAAVDGDGPTSVKGFVAAMEQLLPALQDLALSATESSQDAATGRKLLAPMTTTQLKTASRVNLLAADAFSMVYTGGNLARAIFGLMGPMVVAGQTGTISVNAEYLLNSSQLLANFVAMLGDTLSKGSKLTADGIAPI